MPDTLSLFEFSPKIIYFYISEFYFFFTMKQVKIHYGVAHGGTSSEDTLTVINRGRQWGKIETKDDNLDMDTGN